MPQVQERVPADLAHEAPGEVPEKVYLLRRREGGRRSGGGDRTGKR